MNDVWDYSTRFITSKTLYRMVQGWGMGALDKKWGILYVFGWLARDHGL